MRVTRVENVTKTRYRIEIEGQFAFELYKGELSHYHLAEDTEISEDIYQEIMEEIVVKRAKKKAMDLLNVMDRTEGDLRQKLEQNGFLPEVAEAAVAYVKSFGYIDDERYVRLYIENRKGKRSRREISAGLVQKGVARETIDQAMEAYYEKGDASEAVRALLQKKHFRPEEADPVQTQKMYAYLARKGFSYEDIRKAVQELGDSGACTTF